MKISKQAQRDAKSLFSTCRVNGVLDGNRVKQAVGAVIAQKPRGYVGVLHHFQRLVRLDVERRTARVESAVALSPQQQSSVQANLERKYGAGLSVDYTVNPTLIGGLKIRVGSDVYDGSVAARLDDIASSL